MSTRHMFLLTLSLLAIISAASAARKSDVLVGGYKPIDNLNDPYVQGVAKFAVTQHNKDKNDNLKLVKIVKGESQVVAGTNYRLIIETSDSQKYQAVVYDRPWQKVRSLTSFAAV